MTRYTSLLALFAIILSILATLSVIEAAPAVTPTPTPGKPDPKPKPKPSKPKPKPTKPKKVPSFLAFAGNNLSGASTRVTGYGCHPINTGAVSSVVTVSKPIAKIQFYEGTGCTGKVSHVMDSSTIEAMGGPYKAGSVKVIKPKAKPTKPTKPTKPAPKKPAPKKPAPKPTTAPTPAPTPAP